MKSSEQLYNGFVMTRVMVSRSKENFNLELI